MATGAEQPITNACLVAVGEMLGDKIRSLAMRGIGKSPITLGASLLASSIAANIDCGGSPSMTLAMLKTTSPTCSRWRLNLSAARVVGTIFSHAGIVSP